MRRRGGRPRNFGADRCPRRLADRLAVMLGFLRKRVEIMDGQRDAALAREDPLEIVEPGFGVEPRDVVRLGAIVEENRLDPKLRRRRDDRLEQRGAEGKQPVAGSGRAFGKQRDRTPACERVAKVVRLILVLAFCLDIVLVFLFMLLVAV